jgi:predicted nucleic acid-binding protein
MSGTNLYYWDTCVFLAWIKDEANRRKGEMEGLKSFVRKLDKREIRVITSAIIYTEAPAFKFLDDDGNEKFYQFMRRSNISVASVDIKVAKKASKLRDYYKKCNGKTLCTPDALHLATAILYKTKEFHTFDGSDKKSLGLLGLNGDVGVHNLIICKPQDKQFEMNMDI